MKFAVITTGGKQYLVSKGDVLDFEKLSGKEGDSITFEEVLMLSDDGKVTVGEPHVKGATVTGKIVKEYKDKKVTGLVYKPKKRMRRKFGHRQTYTQVEITKV